MPLKIDARDQKLLWVAAAIFVLLIVGAAVLGGDTTQKSQVPSSYATGAGGAKAAYLLLAHEGYSEKRWERPLSELPQDEDQEETLILAEPIEAPTRRL